MDIKSTVNKPVFGFESITVGSLLFSILYGFALSIIIIAAGQATALKVLMIFGTLAMMAGVLGNLGGEEKKTEIKKVLIVIFFALIVCEVGLYHHSSYDETTPITVITTKKIDPGKSTYLYVVIKYHNNITNEVLAEHKINKNDPDTIKFYKNVDGVRSYIEYTPFITYKEKIEYKRTDNK